jgi:sugar lactone lactonase YvrE
MVRFAIFCLLLCSTAVPVFGDATLTGLITTIAGTGVSGFSGDGGPATAAQLTLPIFVARDAAGNLFIVDDVRIRKITAATGVISTVAGTGTVGLSADGGQATAAELWYPTGVAVDGAGNVFIAEASRVRKVTAATGIISTIAGSASSGFDGDGGPATAAHLAGAAGVALDSAGNVYIADRYNHRIRKVAVATGIITTVAGNGSGGFDGDGGAATAAQLNSPSGVAVDIGGNLYITDLDNKRIRKVEASTGVITTVAGNGLLGYGGDGGPAIAAPLNLRSGVTVDATGNVYMAERLSDRIRMVTAATGLIATVAGSGRSTFGGDDGAALAAGMFWPEGVAVDEAGNLYIADTRNFRIRRVAASRIRAHVISTIAGNGTAAFAGDGGPATGAALNAPVSAALDSAGNLYFVDEQNYRIRKIASSGLITTVAGNGTIGPLGDGGPATDAQLEGANGIALDAAGKFYIADGHRIRKVTIATGIIATVAGTTSYGFSGDGGPATLAQLDYPTGIALDGSGNLFIADARNYRVRKVAVSTGTITTVAGTGTEGFSGDDGPATSAQLGWINDLATDHAGNLYVADQTNYRIRKVTVAAGVIATIAGNGTNEASQGWDGRLATQTAINPAGVRVDAAGNVYVLSAASIRKVTALTGLMATVAGGPSDGFGGDGGLALAARMSAWGFTVDRLGNLLIADTNNHRIRKTTFVDPFTNDPLIAGVVAKAAHVSEVRDRINILRRVAGLPTVAWAEAITAASTLIKASHVLEMRSALADVYSTRGLAVPVYSSPNLAAGMTLTAAHIAEIRTAVVAIE